MSRDKPKRRLRPRFESLESRGLLSSSAQFIGFGNVDTTGPTAAVGPGGYKNLDLKLVLPLGSSGRATNLQYLNIAGPAGFQWTFGNQGSGDSNPRADPKITVAPGVIDSRAMTETYEISISPVVLFVDPITGSASTSSLPNNSRLSFTDEYTIAGAMQATTDTPQSDPALIVTATGLDQNLADPAPTLPALGFETYPGTAAVQTPDGNGHILINNLPIGSVINPATAELSDVAGLYWNTDTANNGSHGRPELEMSISYSNDNTIANVAFPPERDEMGTTMTFRFQLNGSPTDYVTDVAMGDVHTDPNQRDGGPVNPNATPVMVSPTSSATPNMVTYTTGGTQSRPVDIQTFLNMGFRNIVLTDGPTGGVYTINEQLNIPSGMILQGADSNVTLNFTMSSVTQGVIDFASSHITLKGFKIRFQDSTVSFTGLDGSAPAIISDLEAQQVQNQDNQHSRVDLNIENLDIQAPYVPFAPNTADASDTNPRGAINTVYTVEMGQFDSGTIAGNTIRGGTVQVYFGPWQISGNQVLGAVQGTLSDNAFGINGGHDVSLSNNTVTDLNTAQNGSIDRFLTANGSGYNFNLSLNTVGGNIGMPAPNPNGPSSGNPRNNPEEIVFEDYRKTFEGSVLAVGVSSSSSTSNDRRVVAIPTAELALFSGGQGSSGLTLTVLDGPNAGTSIPVLQSFNSGETPTPTFTYFLLATPLPQGTFDLDISPAYVNPVIYKNTIDTSGTISTGLVLATTIVNAQVTYNTFRGDQSSEAAGYGSYQSQAIRIELHGANYGSGPESYNVISAAIDHNTIINAIGGIKMYLAATSLPTTYGRSYGFASLTNNTFQYSYPNPAIIGINVSQAINYSTAVYNASYSKLVNGSVVYDPTAAHFVDPRTLVVTASGNSVQWTGGPPPTTDVTVNAAEINGVLYEANANPNPPLLPVGSSPTPTNLLDFDFTQPNEPVASGYAPVSQFTQYSSTRGYGLTDPRSGDVNADSSSVYGTMLTFRVDLPAGSYLVTPTLGYQGNASDSAAVYLQGLLVGSLPTGLGNQTKSFVAVVTSGGYLTLETVGSGHDTIVHVRSLAILPLRFQSNPGSTSSQPGDTPIYGFTNYGATTGYGFSSQSVNLNSAPGAVIANDMTFQVDLPDGLYDVTPTIGGGESFVQVFLQGSPSRTDALSSPASSSLSQTYLVDVTDGQLSLRLLPLSGSSVYLNSLTIVPRAMPLEFRFGPGGSAVPAGSDAISNFTIYDPGPGYGFTQSVMMNVPPSGDSPNVYASDMTFRADLPDGTYRVTATLAGTGTGDEVAVTLQGTQVDTLATASGPVSKSYVVVVQNGYLTLRLTGEGPDGRAAIENLAISPSSPAVNADGQFSFYKDSGGYDTNYRGDGEKYLRAHVSSQGYGQKKGVKPKKGS